MLNGCCTIMHFSKAVSKPVNGFLGAEWQLCVPFSVDEVQQPTTLLHGLVGKLNGHHGRQTAPALTL